MFHMENAYHIPNTRVRGWACKTNLPSNTAFRGFGGPQGMFAAEHMIRDVARAVGKSFEEVGMFVYTNLFEITFLTVYIFFHFLAELNLYRGGEYTHYNQLIENCNVRR